MAGKREKPEDILMKLRQVEVLQGLTATFLIGVTNELFVRANDPVKLLKAVVQGQISVAASPPVASNFCELFLTLEQRAFTIRAQRSP